MDTEASRQRSTLRRIARRAMIERGLLPDFSHAALAELDGIRATAAGSSGWPRDMRNLKKNARHKYALDGHRVGCQREASGGDTGRPIRFGLVDHQPVGWIRLMQKELE